MALYRCAACGSPNVVTDTQAGGISYNYAKGALGTVVLGVGGAAAGIQSSTQQVFKCPDCGTTLTYSMPQDIKQIIDLGVISADARNNLSLAGVPLTWEFLLSKFKNIESGSGDYVAAMREEEQRQAKMRGLELLKSKSTATQEEFNAAIDQIKQFEHRMGRDRSRYAPVPSDEFTAEKPPTLAEYLTLCHSVDVFIENYFQYLELAENFDVEYRGLPLRNSFEGYLGFYIYCRYLVYSGEFAAAPFRQVAEYILSNAYYAELVKTYQEFYRVHNLRSFTRLLLSGMYLTVVEDVVVPRFLVKDGALCYWDTTFLTSPLYFYDEDDLLEHLQKQFFLVFPDKKAEYDLQIKEHNSKVSNARNHASQINAERKKIKEKIDFLLSEISSEEAVIAKLKKKIFGKKKAEEQILNLQANISKQKSQLKAHRKEMNQLKTEPLQVESESDFTKRLNQEYGYFIVWHQVNEPNVAVD